MKATEAKLLDFLKKSHQLVVPIYQRTYSWTESECSQLWDDICSAGRKDGVNAHFIGSVVYVEAGLYSVSSQSPLLVIDGQQRCTTIALLLEALSRALGDDEPVDGFSASKLRKRYLINDDEKDERRHKLLLSETDRNTLISLIDNLPPPVDPSIRITENFEFFEDRLKKLNGKLDVVCNGLAKLVIVDISLSSQHDNPQLIFESLNSTGKELSQADLIRNYILMGLEPALQSKLYKHYWRKMELSFGQQAYQEHFDSFMRHYLTVRTGEIPRIQDVYEKFKQYSRTEHVNKLGPEELVKEISKYAEYYCAIALGKEQTRELHDAFNDLRELKVEVAYPFLLELYDDYVTGVLGSNAAVEIVRLVESYVFRRAICSIPTNSLNKTFATFARGLDKANYLESAKLQLMQMPSYRRFPANDEFTRELKQRDLYHFPRRSYWLRKLENHQRKEPVNVDSFTIEHILPQNPELSDAWRAELGENWQAIQSTFLHTLGNLTLTGYNSEYSDRSFKEKRDLPEKGFKSSPLHLNASLANLDCWDLPMIEARADLLVEKALHVWACPQVDAELLSRQQKKASSPTNYTIADHPNLNFEKAGFLFEPLRKLIVELDPCVSEEFRKLYVAYKAETNFVDIIPHAKGLLLSLGIKPLEVNDPRGECEDVTSKQRWGNGSIEYRLKALEDIPYAMSLIRQAFEKQMGEGEET